MIQDNNLVYSSYVDSITRVMNLPISIRKRTSKRYSFWLYLVLRLACVVSPLFAIALLIQGASNCDVKESRLYQKHRNEEGSVVKTIKTIEGDVVIDCIDIYKQPGLNHPMLRDHKIQMKPVLFPDRTNASGTNYVTNNEIHQEWHSVGRCPDGTIPIERLPLMSSNHRHSTLGSHLPISYQGNEARPMFQNVLPHEHAVVHTERGEYYGAKASMSVWNPRVEAEKEFSLAQIWVLSEGFLNAIEAGWTVHPALYGDNRTRFFTFWTGDKYKKIGCYNLMCPGFIQTNNDLPLNFALAPISPLGDKLYEITIEIFMDKPSGDWWLFVQGKQMGYWPGKLLPALATGAYMVEWGGEVVNGGRGRHTSTEMGSGFLPNRGFKRSSYFRNIKIVDELHFYRDPVRIIPLVHRHECYDLRVGGRDRDGRDRRSWGVFFYYGGPGRSVYCP